jgi:hypothetical protein
MAALVCAEQDGSMSAIEEHIAVPILESEHFGRFLAVPFPPECNVMIVCVNEGYGMKPVRVLLPHQLYVESIRKLIEDYPSARWITCIPANSQHYVDVWSRDSL